MLPALSGYLDLDPEAILRLDLQVIACLKNGEVPANLHFAELNPHIDLVGLALPTEALCLEEQCCLPQRLLKQLVHWDLD